MNPTVIDPFLLAAATSGAAERFRMNLHWVDLLIIGLYMAAMIAIGWVVTKLAARNVESYFLAGKSLPWWIIGIAHGSSGIDVSGTMWFVTMLFTYGVKATWLLWIWPLFNVIFRMVYLGVWVRRSNVLTGAEWMYTRFGRSRGAELAYVSVVVYALVSVIGFTSYAFQGIGKFAAPFFPWDLSFQLTAQYVVPSPYVYGTIIMLVAGAYCVLGGMYSVVMNDLVQYSLIFVAAISIGVVTLVYTTPEQVAAAVPAGWDQLFPGWELTLDWSSLLPELNRKLYESPPVGDGYSLFGLLTLMLLFKGVLVSMAGPTPNYAIQHVLSTRSPREAALENMCMAVVSLGPRFLLIAGIAVLGLVFFSPDLAAMGTKVDFEQILPNVLSQYVPFGLRGIIIAALIAAFMSTAVSTVNSGAAYIVNDVYKRYVNAHAPPKRYVHMGYIVSALVVLLGVAVGFWTKSIHQVTEWIVSALLPAFVPPNVLKWHWWRFNGYGFLAGMVGGTAAATGILLLSEPHVADAVMGFASSLGGPSAVSVAKFVVKPPIIVLFLGILGISLVASVIVCLLTKPESDDVLKSFYRQVRPWGFWNPIYQKLRDENPRFKKNQDFARDVFNVAVGMFWQTSMVTLPIYLVIQEYVPMCVSLAVLVITSTILKFTWYDRLGPGEMYLTENPGDNNTAAS